MDHPVLSQQIRAMWERLALARAGERIWRKSKAWVPLLSIEGEEGGAV